MIATLHAALGYRAIALGTALGSLVNAFVLIGVFQRRVGGLITRDLGWSVLKMIAAAGLMGAAALLALRGTESPGRASAAWSPSSSPGWCRSASAAPFTPSPPTCCTSTRRGRSGALWPAGFRPRKARPA